MNAHQRQHFFNFSFYIIIQKYSVACLENFIFIMKRSAIDSLYECSYEYEPYPTQLSLTAHGSRTKQSAVVLLLRREKTY